jgi:uncharacterized membrane protein
MDIHHLIEKVAIGIEVLGIVVMTVGIIYAFIAALKKEKQQRYQMLRQRVGRAILLGLEILVAADIILTITTKPTFESVAVLGLVVLIRTFLSFSLEAELDGEWPWQKKNNSKRDAL